MLIGMALGIMAAFVWAGYGIAQKILLRTISPGRIMRFIYLAGALALTPLSSPSAFLELDSLQMGCLLFACINTIIAYGAFSTAMNNWHAAKVSAVVTTTPLRCVYETAAERMSSTREKGSSRQRGRPSLSP